MTIYRIHHDDNYLIHEIKSSEVIDKLGRDYHIHINRTPMDYAKVWPLAFNIVFKQAVDGVSDLPDIAARNGRLFVNDEAHNVLLTDLKCDGEFLSVQYDGGAGFIFNPLVVADERDAIDTKLTVYDENQNLVNLGFINERLSGVSIFRTQIDNYQGIFCHSEFKKKIEETGLKGIVFSEDLSSPMP